MKIKGLHICFIFLLLLADFCSGLQAQTAVPDYRFEHITVNEGLAHSDAMSVVEGSLGFIWIGTNNGINRYNGYDLKHYQLPASDPSGVSSNRVRILYVDWKGVLWAGTEHAGVYFYDQKTDQFLKPAFAPGKNISVANRQLLNTANVKSMLMDQVGKLWVATTNHGVFCIIPGKDAVISDLSRVALGAPANVMFSGAAVLVTTAGEVLIGTVGEGLWAVKPGAKSVNGIINASRNNDIEESSVVVLQKGKNGSFWAASETYVYQLTPVSNGQIRARRLPERFSDIQCIYPDSYGQMWVGTNFGLHLIQDLNAYLAAPAANPLRHFLPKDWDASSINSARIHQISQDSFGNLWLAASAGGVNKTRLQPKGFHHLGREISRKTTLPNSFVNAIARDEVHGRLWIGTRNGYSVFDEKTGEHGNFLGRVAGGNVTARDVSAMCVVGDEMWIGTRYGGLFHANLARPQAPAAFPAFPGASPWNYMSIESIVKDAQGRIWVGTFGGGLHLFSASGQFIRNYTPANSPLPTTGISFLLPDKTGRILWASTPDQGVLKIGVQGQNIRILRQFKHEPGNEQSLKVNFAWPLLADQSGNIWIGTIGGGLHKLSVKNGQEIIERYQHHIPDNDIEGILSDEKGNLWLAGAGLKKFNPITNELVHYDVSDGLQSNSFKVGAAFKSTGGTMYFGGTNGLTWFKPEQINPNPLPPVVRITGLRVLNKNPEGAAGEPGNSMVTRTFSQEEGIVLHADENDFSFEFVGLNYVNPQKQSYAFMMEGYSNDWIQLPKGQRVASFANLPPGDYLFKVKANNGEGVWSEEPASIQVKVLPPWYRTWWAYLLYLVIVAAALIWYRNLTTSRLKLENRLALEKLKSDNEREMAEMKAMFFTGVSHEFRTPLTLILGPMEEFMHSLAGSESMREKVMMMHKQTRKLLDLVNQLLSFRKVESGAMQLQAARQDVVSFIKELFSIFKIKAQELGLDYQLHLPLHEVLLYFDAEKLEVILTNLLSNSFKYSQAGGKVQLAARVIGSADTDAVWHEAELADNYFEISVADTGRGISEEEMGRIFDPYFQATNAAATVGTGIGLALVKEFVARHSGNVVVKSRLGEGTTFVIRLPFGKTHLLPHEVAEKLREQVFAAPPMQIQAVEENSGSTHSTRILIVEDNADLRLYLAGLFENEYQVSLAADGAAGWTRAAALLPDLVISDVNMPSMNGLELSQKLKQNPKTTHIPVILLTARAAAVQELEGLETGADDYIVKPFNADVLKAKVQAILGNRGRLRDYYQRQILLEPTEVIIPDEDKLFLEKAMQIVEGNLTNSDFNVQALVHAMNMSQSVFYRRIKSITGQTVIEFIKDVRLKRAAQLLRNPHARASEVAFLVGIEDPKNFRVSFQKRYGVSPAQYARMQREGEGVHADSST